MNYKKILQSLGILALASYAISATYTVKTLQERLEKAPRLMDDYATKANGQIERMLFVEVKGHWYPIKRIAVNKTVIDGWEIKL